MRLLTRVYGMSLPRWMNATLASTQGVLDGAWDGTTLADEIDSGDNPLITDFTVLHVRVQCHFY